MTRRAPFILMAAVVCAGAFGAWRADARDPATSPPAAAPAETKPPAWLLDAAARAPHDVSTLIVARDLASIRKAAASRSVMEIVESLKMFSSSRLAWGALARQLGMTPTEAFDALLGEQAILMIGSDGDAQQGWALTSRVPLATAKRLGSALGATPRSQLAGLPVFALENGAFILHIRSERNDASAWITIGPGDRPTLFRRLLDPPAHARTLTEQGRFTDLIRSLPAAGDAFVYRRLAPDAPDFAVGAVRVAGPTLVTTYAAYASPHEQEPPPGWSREAFEALEARSLLTVADSGQTSAGRFLDAAGRGLIGPIKALSTIFQPFPRGDLIGDRGVVTIRRAAHGGIGLAYAIDTPDTAALATVGDDYMASQLAALFPQRINAKQRIDTAGFAPEATRSVSMRGTGVAALLRNKDSANFAWSYTPNAAPKGNEKTPGWWIAGIDPDTVQRTASSLSAHAETGGWTALASIRPAELAALLDSAAMLPIPRATLAMMARVDRVTLSERRLDASKVVGSVSVEFSAAPPAPAPAIRDFPAPLPVGG